jgi:hypothetical protein
MSIPTFLIEEHHEAFAVWNYATANGLIPGSKNTLLHVDEHADMGAPRLTRRLDSIAGDLHRVWDFTYHEISIYEFIVTAVYQGLFDRVTWLKPGVLLRQRQNVSVCSYLNNGKVLRLNPGLATPGTDGRSAVYEVQTLRDSFSPATSLVLDIDLDYFSCDQAENQTERLEVSEAEYHSFLENRYHFLRINQGNRVQARREGDSFFLYLKCYDEAAPCPLKVPVETIVSRIDDFIAYLQRDSIQPRIIDIARSRMSGYTPLDQWEFIERRLIEGLGRIYDLDVRHLAGIAPQLVSTQ